LVGGGHDAVGGVFAGVGAVTAGADSTGGLGVVPLAVRLVRPAFASGSDASSVAGTLPVQAQAACV
jgi:hypothetical protein